jgi:hypothetical protein
MQKNDFEGLRSQKGAALLIMFLALFMVSAAVLLKGLGKNPSLRQDATTTKALAQAKEALLGYAVSNTTSPGSFPCPDTDDNGEINPGCSGDSLGRLPWKGLGIGDIRDGSGERLWYALTEEYHGATINSTTPGALSLDGQNDIVAVIIAPSQALTGQTRPNNTAANYLEAGPVSGVNYTTCSDPDTCNDTIQVFRRKELMSLITARAAKEIKKELDHYHNDPVNAKYPDDQAAFQVAMTPPLDSAEVWVTNNQWPNVTTYTGVDTNTATLQFADCASTFTLTFGADTIVRSPNTCQ